MKQDSCILSFFFFLRNRKWIYLPAKELEYLPARRVQRVGIIGKMIELVECKEREIELNHSN